MSDVPSITQLVDAPELAALHVLEAALNTAERALIAAHPELDEGFDPPQGNLAPEAWLADAVLIHLTALESALLRYRARLRVRGLLGADRL